MASSWGCVPRCIGRINHDYCLQSIHLAYPNYCINIDTIKYIMSFIQSINGNTIDQFIILTNITSINTDQLIQIQTMVDEYNYQQQYVVKSIDLRFNCTKMITDSTTIGIDFS